VHRGLSGEALRWESF